MVKVKKQMNIIEVEQLRKNYKEIKAVKGISFFIKQGEIFGLLGPNGAGKSTTIKILVTLLKASGGRAWINGFDINKESQKVRSSVGIIFQDPSLDERLTAWENLYFHSRLYHVPQSQIAERINRSLELVELSERKKHLVRNFSGGMKRRLEIARGIIHTPKVLFLDEPTLGLDPQTRVNIWQYLSNLRKSTGITMLLTTHYMEEAEICDRIAIMDHGEIIALDTPDNLKKGLKKDIVILTVDNNEAVAPLIRQEFGVETISADGEIRISVENARTFIPLLFKKFSEQINSVDIKKPSLEDVFIKLTGKKIREEEASGTDKLREMVKRRRRH
jgi:ABC-2 type transport system ATP-binding protein